MFPTTFLGYKPNLEKYYFVIWISDYFTVRIQVYPCYLLHCLVVVSLFLAACTLL